MRICFSGIGCGFGNNGGSKTIMSCANVLHALGHKVSVATKVYDFTWFKLRAERVKSFPDNADVIIATATSTVEPLLRHKTKAKKIWYVRGWETWSTPKHRIIKLVKSIPIIVNSSWLKQKINKYAKKPSVIYPGLDTDIFYPEHRQQDGITIGGLYNTKGLKRFSLWKSIVSSILQKRSNVKVRLFGNGPAPKLPFKFKYTRQPQPDKHRKFYNSVDIWLFTSSNEGLHIPPMEAGLCGCAITGSDIGGVRDYAIHKETALLGQPEELEDNVLRLIDDQELRNKLATNLRDHLLSRIGSRTHNMNKLVNILK